DLAGEVSSRRVEARRRDRNADAERLRVAIEPARGRLPDARELGCRTPPSPVVAAGRDGMDDRGHEAVDQRRDGGPVVVRLTGAAWLRLGGPDKEPGIGSGEAARREWSARAGDLGLASELGGGVDAGGRRLLRHAGYARSGRCGCEGGGEEEGAEE